MTPCQGVIQDHDWIGTLQSQEQNAGFTGTEIRDQTDDLFARQRTHIDPRQLFRDREIEASTPSLGQFVRNGGWDDDPRDQFRQKRQMPDLVQILERRGITDDIRQGMSDAPDRPR